MKRTKTATTDKQKPKTQPFIKVSASFLDQEKLTNRQIQYCLALKSITQNSVFYPGCLMKKEKREVKDKGFSIKQFWFVKDRDGVSLDHKAMKMLGVSSRQLWRVIKLLKEMGIIQQKHGFLIVRDVFYNGRDFVKVPVEVAGKKIWSKGFKASAWLRKCVEAQKGKVVKASCSRMTEYRHRKSLDHLMAGITEKIEGIYNEIHLRDPGRVKFRSVPYWKTKRKKIGDKDYLASNGRLYKKPKDPPSVNVTFSVTGLHFRWIPVENGSNPKKTHSHNVSKVSHLDLLKNKSIRKPLDFSKNGHSKESFPKIRGHDTEQKNLENLTRLRKTFAKMEYWASEDIQPQVSLEQKKSEDLERLRKALSAQKSRRPHRSTLFRGY